MTLLERISRDFQLPSSYILQVANSASFQYKTFKIPKKSGGQRSIHHPTKALKAMQRWCLAHIIEHLPISDYAFAYRKGISTLDNAKKHISSDYLLRIDLLNFFPSITEEDIRNYIDANPTLFPEWGLEDKDLFCAFVCRFKRLTIGAPTSPSLSNALCRQMDIDLKRLADDYRVSYSRYADDLFLSTERPNVLKSVEKDVYELVSTIQLPSNLRINKKKTRHYSKKVRRKVTGIILTSDGGVSLGRELKRYIKSLIYKMDTLDEQERKRLAGYIAYCRSIEPDYINRLILKFGFDRINTAQSPDTGGLHSG